MHNMAFVIDLMLGMVEFVVINRTLRKWMGANGLAFILLAIAASDAPAVGGVTATMTSVTEPGYPLSTHR